VDAPDAEEFIAGLRALVDEAIDGLEMHLRFRSGTDIHSRELAANYLWWTAANLRDAEAWGQRFCAKPS
jgi:hypothetical protein